MDAPVESCSIGFGGGSNAGSCSERCSGGCAGGCWVEVSAASECEACVGSTFWRRENERAFTSCLAGVDAFSCCSSQNGRDLRTGLEALEGVADKEAEDGSTDGAAAVSLSAAAVAVAVAVAASSNFTIVAAAAAVRQRSPAVAPSDLRMRKRTRACAAPDSCSGCSICCLCEFSKLGMTDELAAAAACFGWSFFLRREKLKPLTRRGPRLAKDRLLLAGVALLLFRTGGRTEATTTPANADPAAAWASSGTAADRGGVVDAPDPRTGSTAGSVMRREATQAAQIRALA